MEIATGYFARAKTYAEMGYALVSIAKVAPWFIAKDLTLYDCDALKPTDEILELKDEPEKYELLYRKEVLGKTSGIKIFHFLYGIAHQEFSSKVVLMCYESPEKFCHRHIVAKWIEETIGNKVAEVDIRGFKSPTRDLFASDVV